MRTPPASRFAAANIQTTEPRRRDETLVLVCGALALALVMLAGRIIAAW